MGPYTLYIAADHRGVEKKQKLVEILQACHPGMVQVKDLGPEKYDAEDDYNDAAIAVAKAVLGDAQSFGILLCGSAHGVTMQSNRFRGIRAVNADTVESAKHARTNDYANVLCLSADYLELTELDDIIKAFCHTQPDPAEKYQRRAERLDSEI